MEQRSGYGVSGTLRVLSVVAINMSIFDLLSLYSGNHHVYMYVGYM